MRKTTVAVFLMLFKGIAFDTLRLCVVEVVMVASEEDQDPGNLIEQVMRATKAISMRTRAIRCPCDFKGENKCDR
jgi:hypothetical protein